MKLQIKLSTIYTILFAFAFLTISTVWNFNYWIKYILAAAWCVVLLILMRNRKEELFFFRKYFSFFILPFIIMLIHLPLAYGVQNQNITSAVLIRVVSYFAQRCILIATSVLTAVYFKKNTIKYTFKALALSYFVIVIAAIAKFGPSSFVRFALSAWKAEWNTASALNTISTALEFHDVTFALGLFVLYYVLFSENKLKNHKAELIISVVFMWLGFKRIEIVAVLFCILAVVLFFRKTAKNYRVRFLVLFAIILVISIGYLAIIKSDEITQLATEYGIDFNGRLHNYKTLANYYDLSPLFIGRGYCYTTLLVEKLSTLTLVHSDIIRSFIDYGFIGFVLWQMFYMYFAPSKLSRIKNANRRNNPGVVFCILSLFSMINFMTDNVNVYFAYQICYLIIPLSLMAEQINDNKNQTITETKSGVA